jgi:hypothetical protein
MESNKKQIYVITAYYYFTDADFGFKEEQVFYTTSSRKADRKMKELEADESAGMYFLDEFDLI